MISEIQYGGRITDDFDRTLMNTYAEQYFHQGVMDKACQLYPGYKVPDGLEISNFRTVSGLTIRHVLSGWFVERTVGGGWLEGGMSMNLELLTHG
jgi:hypothetical protein